MFFFVNNTRPFATVTCQNVICEKKRLTVTCYQHVVPGLEWSRHIHTAVSNHSGWLSSLRLIFLWALMKIAQGHQTPWIQGALTLVIVPHYFNLYMDR